MIELLALVNIVNIWVKRSSFKTTKNTLNNMKKILKNMGKCLNSHNEILL